MIKETATKVRQVAIFELGGETYGLDIDTVHEILPMQPITRVPKAPVYVEGVINLRGKVTPVVDMGKRFGLNKAERTKNTRIVVVNIDGTTIGIIVDAVTEVLRIPLTNIESPSTVISAGDMGYLQGIAKLGDKIIILLDLGKVLSKDSMFSQVSLLQNSPERKPQGSTSAKIGPAQLEHV
jgi:purine-binding chemotaxis protein CheW